MLKFRLPWTAGTRAYLEGTIFWPVFGPITTTESRLIVLRDAKETDYDNTVYEEEMFYFNTVQRPALYDHTVIAEGLCRCYDCRSEVHILTQYLTTVARPDLDPVVETDMNTIAAEVANMSMRISRRYGTARPAHKA